jgi:hypothetical protein
MATMDISRTEVSLDRLDRLERESRFLKRALALTVLAGFGLAVLGAIPDEKPKDVDTKRITLRDNDGKIRAVFEVDKDGLPVLSFFDKKQEERIHIGISEEDGPVVSVLDKEKNGGIYLEVSQFESTVSIQNGLGGYLANLSVTHRDLKDVEPAAQLFLARPQLLAAEPKGEESPSLEFYARPKTSGIMFQDKAGKSTWLGCDDDGTSTLIFHDKEQKERLVLGRNADDSTFVKILDKDGKVLHRAP